MRGTIILDEGRCKGCELCISVCPKGLIHLADYFTPRGYRPAILVDPLGACTGCLLCSTICPEGGIMILREAARRTMSQGAGLAPAVGQGTAPGLTGGTA